MTVKWDRWYSKDIKRTFWTFCLWTHIHRVTNQWMKTTTNLLTQPACYPKVLSSNSFSGLKQSKYFCLPVISLFCGSEVPVLANVYTTFFVYLIFVAADFCIVLYTTKVHLYIKYSTFFHLLFKTSNKSSYKT